MSSIRVVEVDGDRYIRLNDVLGFLSETEADLLRKGDDKTAIAVGAVRTVLKRTENTELNKRRWPW